jgi:hypothetical protein
VRTLKAVIAADPFYPTSLYVLLEVGSVVASQRHIDRQPALLLGPVLSDNALLSLGFLSGGKDFWWALFGCRIVHADATTGLVPVEQ